MNLPCPPKITKEAFPSDRIYTINALVEELFLIERHVRDTSYRKCDCTPSKHLPGVAGLASEGYGFAEGDAERGFMECLMNQARLYRSRIEEGKLRGEEQWNEVRDWARRARHMLSARDWEGKQDVEEQISYAELSPVMAEAVNGLTGSVADIEERYVDELLTALAAKHGVAKPRYRFIEGCNPLVPQAWQVSRDLKFRTLRGDVVVVRPEDDELVFCRGQTSPYSVAHEACHHIQRVNEGKTDERYATECGLAEVQSVETLNTLTLQDIPGGKMAKGIGQIVTGAKKAAPLVGGVLVGELVDEAGYIEQFVTPIAGAYGNLAKGIVGLAISGAGLALFSGVASDFVLGVGLPIAVSGFRAQFMPAGTTLKASLGATQAAALAYPRALTPYATPTGLRAGHPTLNVPVGGSMSRLGVLAPSSLPSGLSGKFNLGSRA